MIMETRKIVLIGKTGEGKSSAGNTILRKEVFDAKASANAITTKSVRADGMLNGRKITVVDTPGFFDTDRDEMETKSEIIKALVECAPDVHAIALVLKVGRYTKQENEVVQEFLSIMNEDALKHTVILFTFGEQLEGQTIEEFVKVNPKLQELVNKCGGRCHVIDNKYWNECDSGYKSNRVQLKNLLETIDKMVKDKGCFTNELLQRLEEKIEEQVKINRDDSTPEEKREKAKKIIHDKLLKQAVGATTGVLLGALVGLAVPVIVFVALLQNVSPLIKMLKGKAAVAAASGAVVTGGAMETGAAGGAKATTAGSSTAIIAVVFGVAGALVGGVTGWKAAEDADSVYDAMIKAAKANYENGKCIIEKTHELLALAMNKKP